MNKDVVINSLCIRIGDDFNIDENIERLWEAAIYAGIDCLGENTPCREMRKFYDMALDYYYRRGIR